MSNNNDPSQPASQPASPQAVAAALQFARMAGRLKTTPRTGWVRRGVPRYESVADHSWRVAVLSLLLSSSSSSDANGTATATTPHQLDLQKCLALGVVHDLAEAVVGDIAPDDGIPKRVKQDREHAAMTEICQTLSTATLHQEGDDEHSQHSLLQSLFEEYEARKTPEAVAVKDLDLLDMILQADEYEQTFAMDLSDFFKGTPASRFQTPFLKQVATAIHNERQERIEKTKEQESLEESNSLSKQDAAFLKEYSKASRLDEGSIEEVIRSLRQWESR